MAECKCIEAWQLQVSFDGCIERSEPLGDADLPPKIAQLPQKGGEKGAHDFVELRCGVWL